MQIANDPVVSADDLDETAAVSPADRQRNLRRAVRSAASRLGKLRECLRRGQFARAGVSREHVNRWIEAIDEMLGEFGDLPAGFLTRTLADRIYGFLALAEEVLDRLDAAVSATPAAGGMNELSLH
jgi:hypothetical protein